MTKSHLRTTPSYLLADHPMPTGREEIWRFTPIAQIKGLLDDAAPWVPLTPVVDGWDATRAPIGPHTPAPVDRASAIGYNHAPEASVLRLSGEVDQPVTVTYEATGGSQVSQLVIQAAPLSRAVVVLRHIGVGDFIGNVAIDVGEGADLTLVSLQEWDNACHAGWHHGLVGRDAHYRHVAVSLGGPLVRLQSNVSYAGPGGQAELFGLHMTDAGQHHEHRLFVDQNMPKTTSRVDYRGALQGAGAHSVWIGDVLIRRDAYGIDSYEQNRNLLLTNGCIADSVPNLEIETGNIVGAGHSSATGHFDDEQLFYLCSRGIPEAQARRLVVQGFLGEIIRRIGVASIEQRLIRVVDDELERAEMASKENHG